MKKATLGLSLVELMILLALVAISAHLALPSWQDFIAKQRSQALQHSLGLTVQQARSLAVSLGARIELCGSTDGLNCHSDWSKGWILRRQNPSNLEPEVLFHQALDYSTPSLHWSGFQPRIQYRANGLSSTSNGRFYLCYKKAVEWQLILNRQGRLRRALPKENQEANSRCQG